MRKAKEIIIRAAVALLIAALFSCNPAKQVQKQDALSDQLKAKWINEWVNTHPCPPGPEINLDSICRVIWPNVINTNTIDNNLKLPNDDLIFGQGTEKTTDSLRISNQGYIRFYNSGPDIRHIGIPFEDTRHIKLLQDTIGALMIRIATLQGGKEQQSTDCSTQVSAITKAKNKWMWLCIAACVVIVGGVAGKIYGSLNPTSFLSKL